MVAGVITITLWMKFIPDIDGSFVAMLTNGLTMILAHYSLPEKDRQSWQKSSLDHQQLQQARRRRFYRFKKYLSNLFSSLQYTPGNNYHIVLLAFYIFITSWIPLLGRNMPSMSSDLTYWPLIRCLVALSILVDVILNTKRISHNRYIWLSVLMLCFPIDVIWHITCTQDPITTFALAFCHLSVLILLLPIYFNLAIIVLCWTIAIIVGLDTHGLVSTYMANIELFLPATLFLASAVYMQHRYIRKSRQLRLLIAEQQKIASRLGKLILYRWYLI